MKKILTVILLLILSILSNNIYSSEQEDFKCAQDSTAYGGSYSAVQAAIASNSTYYELVIYAVDSNAVSTVIPTAFNDMISDLGEFFSKATFEKFDYSIVLLSNYGEAFRFAYGDTVTFSGLCDHVHSYRNVESVIDSADIIYNFKDFDSNDDDVVDIHFVSSGPKGGGVGQYCGWSFISNDYGTSDYVEVRIKA